MPGDRQSAGINASGQVTGNATATVSGHVEAYLSGPNGTPPFRGLGFLPFGNFSEGFGGNAGGQVIGDSSVADGSRHAFLSGPNGGPLKDLGLLPGGSYSQADSVNDSGQVVGISGSGAFLSVQPGFSAGRVAKVTITVGAATPSVL